jgi:division protein CdvB (Snf7/Vps24/ESCRT-III family)
MLERAMSSIRTQTACLDNSLKRLQEKDRRLFNRMILHLRSNEDQRASILARELVELRKMSRMVIHSKLALEQIIMRISTISDLGEVVATLGPAISAIKSVEERMATVTPQAEESLSEVADLLGSILVDAGQDAHLTLNLKAAGEDAERILDEASDVAEQMMRQKFPDLPVKLPPAKNRDATYA